jgi:hypothetical protein
MFRAKEDIGKNRKDANNEMKLFLMLRFMGLPFGFAIIGLRGRVCV